MSSWGRRRTPPPSSCAGEPPSHRSDPYPWGLIPLECLTGEVARSGRSPHEALMKELGLPPVPIPASLEERLGALLASVTAKDPAARDMSEQALARGAFDRAARREPIRGVFLLYQVLGHAT